MENLRGQLGKKVKKLRITIFFVFSFLFFIFGSVFAEITDNSENLIIPAGESYTLDGPHSYNKSVQIYGNLYVTPYNGIGSMG